MLASGLGVASPRHPRGNRSKCQAINLSSFTFLSTLMGHRPSEIFGYPPENSEMEALRSRREYLCPFLHGRCTKKSTHYLLEGRKTPFGVCSVWHYGRTGREPIPHIICPARFQESNIIFQSTSGILGSTRRLIFVPEVKVSELGTVDWFVVNFNPEKPEIINFYGLEVMAVSTTMTGQIVKAMLDSFKGRLLDKYGYGVNYRQVVSRMIVQLLKKGMAFDSWGRKFIWVIQDALYEYMISAYSLELKDGLEQPVGLSVFSLTKNEKSNRFDLQHIYDKSGTLEDFTRMLAPRLTEVPSEDRVKEILVQKIAKLQLGNPTSLV